MPKPENYPPFAAHYDANQVPTMMGVIGTAGTSDTQGTAQPLPIGVNALTGAMYVQDLSGASGTTNVLIVGGTFNAGTVTTAFPDPMGSVIVTTGTILNTGTNINLVTGTVNVGTFVMPTGTLTTGSLTTLASLVNGSINILTGTTTLVTTVTTVSNLTNGTVRMSVGTLTTGTLQNLVTGTINALAAGTITAGTLTNLVSGTINALASGTISTGTLQNLNYGTINIDPTPNKVKTLITNYGTVGTTGAAVFGTLVPAIGAGTFAYIAGVSITGISGTAEASIIVGTFTQAAPAGGTNMLARVNAVPGGGIAKTFDPRYVSGTNGTICYWLSGAGTVYFDVFYWVAT